MHISLPTRIGMEARESGIGWYCCMTERPRERGQDALYQKKKKNDRPSVRHALFSLFSFYSTVMHMFPALRSPKALIGNVMFPNKGRGGNGYTVVCAEPLQLL